MRQSFVRERSVAAEFFVAPALEISSGWQIGLDLVSIPDDFALTLQRLTLAFYLAHRARVEDSGEACWQMINFPWREERSDEEGI